MVLPDDDESGQSRAAWIRERWRAFAVLALSLPLLVVAVRSSRGWIGQSFPGFFVLENRLVPVVGLYDWTGRTARPPLPPLWRIVAVDGLETSDAAIVYRAAKAVTPGTAIHYGVEKGGERIERVVATMTVRPVDWWLTFGLFLLNGVLTIAAGIAVALLQPTTPASKGFLAFGALSGLIMLSAPSIYNPDYQWLTPVNVVAHAFWGAGFLHLGLVFPVVRPIIRRRPAWLYAPYAASAALGAWSWHAFDVDPPNLVPLDLSFVYVGGAMAALAASYLQLYRADPDPITRMRLRLIGPGLVVSCALASFGFLENAVTGRFPINLAVLFPGFFYVAVAYAIVRHDLFDIDRFVRQAAIYTTVSVVLVAGYAGMLAVLEYTVKGGGSSMAVTVVAVVAVATLFDPLRSRVQRLIDRTFFRERVDYRRTVGEVSAALTTLLDLDEVLARVTTALDAGLAPTSVAVALWTDANARTVRLTSGRLEPLVTCETSAIHAHLVAAGPRSWRVPSTSTTAAAREARALDASLVVPLVVGERVIGAFLLGGKRSGLPYGTSDREVLETLAAQSSIAIENAALFGQVTELNRDLEMKVRDRTAELEVSNGELRKAYRDLQDAQAQLLQSEKMASLGQLTAGLAHEINTPVTAVVSNVKPLSNEIARLRDRAVLHGDATLEASIARLRTIVEVMARGAERTAGIVQDLRVFSRVGETTPLPMDLHEGIDVSLRLLRPRWVDRIEVQKDYGTVPPIEASASQVNQVLMNLLANAFDAIEGTGHVWIATRVEGDDVVVTVHDDGRGIAPEHVGRVFDPFFTTKPIGQGTGLGLAISAGIARDHGGGLTVDSAPGRGATFTLTLPLSRAAAESRDRVRRIV